MTRESRKPSENEFPHPAFEASNMAQIESALHQRLAILDVAQFTKQDTLSVVGMGLTAKALEHTIDPKRGIVTLSSEEANPGTGRRRMFSGADVLKIAAVYSSSRAGFPMRWAYLFANQVATQANNRKIGTSVKSGLRIATYEMKDGDWALIPIYDGETAPKLPVSYQLHQVDRLIDEVLAKLEAIVSDEPIPDFDVPDPVPESSPYSPENDFFLMWDKDKEGRLVRTGLTFEETQELTKLENDGLSGNRNRADSTRYLVLHGKHEAARLGRCSEEPLELPQGLKEALVQDGHK